MKLSSSPVMAAAPANKRRKVDNEYRSFNPAWKEKYFFAERFGKPQCLICLSTVAVYKECNIKRHWETNHANSPKYAVMDREAKLACVSRLEESLNRQASSFNKKSAFQKSNESVTRAGYEISRIIACRMKPFADGDFIKECILSAIETVPDIPSLCSQKKVNSMCPIE